MLSGPVIPPLSGMDAARAAVPAATVQGDKRAALAMADGIAEINSIASEWAKIAAEQHGGGGIGEPDRERLRLGVIGAMISKFLKSPKG